jgi:isopentenyl phosphate kinase
MITMSKPIISQKNQSKPNMQKITLIKLGGSVITHKNLVNAMRYEVLTDLVSQISEYCAENPEDLLIVGHGQGSFAHIPAKMYGTKDGFINQNSQYGMAVTQHSVGQAHQLVIQEMLNQKLPAVSFRVNSSAVTSSSKKKVFSTDVLVEYLRQSLLPVTCGDVVVDVNQGCAIWSTERILEEVAVDFLAKDFMVQRIIHVTDVDGVLDLNDRIINEINRQNAEEVKDAIVDPKVVDVTGGMWHKIQSCLTMADLGVESAIISGFAEKNLYNCLLRKKFIGTTIKAV